MEGRAGEHRSVLYREWVAKPDADRSRADELLGSLVIPHVGGCSKGKKEALALGYKAAFGAKILLKRAKGA